MLCSLVSQLLFLQTQTLFCLVFYCYNHADLGRIFFHAFLLFPMVLENVLLSLLVYSKLAFTEINLARFARSNLENNYTIFFPTEQRDEKT